MGRFPFVWECLFDLSSNHYHIPLQKVHLSASQRCISPTLLLCDSAVTNTPPPPLPAHRLPNDPLGFLETCLSHRSVLRNPAFASCLRHPTQPRPSAQPRNKAHLTTFCSICSIQPFNHNCFSNEINKSGWFLLFKSTITEQPY